MKEGSTEANFRELTGKDARLLIRRGGWRKPTAGLAMGYAQANLVVLPKAVAFDFLLFCQRNPKPCPLIAVTDPGDPVPREVALEADLRTDLPKYSLFVNGKPAWEAVTIRDHWRDDFVAFLLGCSFTFESALLRAGIPVRHVEQGRNVPMYVSSIQCRPAGQFAGPMVVSMRPIPAALVARAVAITARYSLAHGAPVHIGDGRAIGIKDLDTADFGDPVRIETGEVPVFWACGVTPQVAAAQAKPETMITHSPGHMFVTDIVDEALAPT